MKVLLSAFVLVLACSNSSDDFAKSFNKGLKKISEEKFEDAIFLLNESFEQRKHSKTAFWLSYCYAQTENKDKCREFVREAENLEPPLDQKYKERLDQIKDWATQTDVEEEVVFRGPANDGSPPYFEINFEQDRLTE